MPLPGGHSKHSPAERPRYDAEDQQEGKRSRNQFRDERRNITGSRVSEPTGKHSGQ